MKRFALLIAAALCLPASAAASQPQLWSHGPDPAPKHESKGHAARSPNLPETPSETLPQRWCGDEIHADDTTDALQNGAFNYHALYVLPSDAPLALDRVADDIQADAAEASSLLERLYGRAIRFDMGTRCGPQYLDITTVRMPQTKAQLAALDGDALFSAIRDAIAGAGFFLDDGAETGMGTNYVAWLDGPSPAGLCGQAELYSDSRRVQGNLNNTGGKVAAIYDAGTGQCGADVVRHEIGHTLGALQSGAPHAFDGSHCNDAAEDTMCQGNAPRHGQEFSGDEYFDFGNDDYWSPPGGAPLGWWTLDLSRFLCYDPACNVTPAAPAVPAQQVTKQAAKQVTKQAAKPVAKPVTKARAQPHHKRPRPKARRRTRTS